MILEHGCGIYQYQPKTFATEEEEETHYLLLEIRHRRLYEKFGLDYDEAVKTRKAATA